MRALITNDDGIDSPGLAVLAHVALDAGFDVLVAAPAREYSGASASLIGVEDDGRLVVHEKRAPGLEERARSLAVEASPGLITFLAADGAFGERPDVVLSGVNLGPNTGYAIIHSGTVGATFSAMTHDIRGMAVSTPAARPRHLATSGVVAAHCLPWLLEQPADAGVLNVNVPDLPVDELRGIRKAPLARFGAVQASVTQSDGDRLQVTFAEIDPMQDADSDAGLVAAGWATLSYLQAPAYDPDARLPEHLDGAPTGH